jgi:hypothetical protein
MLPSGLTSGRGLRALLLPTRGHVCRLSSGHIPKSFYPLSCFSLQSPQSSASSTYIPSTGTHGITPSSLPVQFFTHSLTSRAVPCLHSHSLTHTLFSARTFTHSPTRCSLPALSPTHPLSLAHIHVPNSLDALDTDVSTVELDTTAGAVSTPPLISYEKILDSSKTSTSHTT